MLYTNLKIVFRQFAKNRSFALINILGLAVAISACLIIWQYVYFHLSFDHQYDKSDQIYRIAGTYSRGDETLGSNAILTPLLGYVANGEMPEVTDYARFWSINYMNSSLIYKTDLGTKMFDESGIYLTDASTFDMFSLEFLYGDAQKFDEPNKLVLNESTALKYFGSDNPVGKNIELSGNEGARMFEVVGVVKDLGENTHMDFNLLLSFATYRKFYDNDLGWTQNNSMNYLLIADPAAVPKVEAFVQDKLMEKAGHVFENMSVSLDLFLQPLADIHLTSDVGHNFQTLPTDKIVVYSLALITVVILFIAWINYLNLSLVKTLDRGKEIGIRRVMGSKKSQLTGLFISEALVINLLGFVLALTISQVLSGVMVELIGFKIEVFENLIILGVLLSLVGVGSLLTGLYPSILLKALKTADVLTGRKTDKVGKVGIRNVMVGLQFVMTFILVAGTIAVYKQITFMKMADLKIDINDTMMIKAPPLDVNNQNEEDKRIYNAFKNGVMNQAVVAGFTNSGEAPGEDIGWNRTVKIKNAPNESTTVARLISMGTNFMDFFGIEVVHGREFREGDNPWSTGECIINVQMAKDLGFDNPAEAVGAHIEGFFAPIHVIGVSENHHHVSLHLDYDPIIYIISSWTEFYFVRFNIDKTQPKDVQIAQLKNGVKTVETQWNEVFHHPMDYSFLDETFNSQYFEDERFGKIFGIFSLLAIFIACLGLYGMFSFALKRRIKEIGIRKVLGAGVADLTRLLTVGYFKILLVSYLLAVPVYFYLTQAWLDNYPFRIDIGLWIYWMPLVVVFLISAITILFRLNSSIKANPVSSLKYE